MKQVFRKMQGCGNDFVILDSRSGLKENWAKLAPRILHRRFGVGGDSLLVLESSDRADVRMRVFERDEMESENCGNGLRCVARILTDESRRDSCTIDTLAGVQEVKKTPDGMFRVNMGSPIFESERIPLGKSLSAWPLHLKVQETEWSLYCLSMGNPHAVAFVEDESLLEEVLISGPVLETHSSFPRRANVEFAFKLAPNHFRVRVWERGAGETLACGTGGCAVGVAAIKLAKALSPVRISFPGGDLLIEWNGDQESVFKTGPAEEVFRGEWLW